MISCMISWQEHYHWKFAGLAHIVKEIAQQLVHGKYAMRDNRTAKLWLQYLEMVEILLSFIKSDRTGNWQLHLKMGQTMLLFLAAAGHSNYEKLRVSTEHAGDTPGGLQTF